jgi:N-carbamoylputrescine amidase
MAKNITLTVAAAQMICQDGDIGANLSRAEGFVRGAVAQGAHLLIFPEFMSTGYRLTSQIWDMGEPFDGPTVRWLKEMAARYHLYVGASFMESDGCDFLNTFALGAPNGQIAGAIRKRFPSLWESYFFKGCDCINTIDTELGRLGVGICFDNHTADVADAIYESNVDMMLMPHSYCTPTQVTATVSAEDIARLNDLPCRVARQYNELFGIPVVLANKSGAWNSPVPPTFLGQPWGYTFSGRSAIIAADGSVRAQLGTDEGLAVAEVTLDPCMKRHTRPTHYGRYIYPGPIGREALRVVEFSGRLSYRLSAQRRRKAAECVTPPTE